MEFYQYIGVITFSLFLILIYIYLKKSRKKSILVSCIVCFLSTAMLVSLDPNINTNENPKKESTSSIINEEVKSQEEAKEEEKNKKDIDYKYLTKLQWADTQNFIFAVEIEDFDGDIVEAGKYNFSSTGITDGKHTAIVWDVYISESLYQNIKELSNSEYITSIGGNSSDTYSIDLKKGQYVYIKYNKTASKPSGILNIEYIK